MYRFTYLLKIISHLFKSVSSLYYIELHASLYYIIVLYHTQYVYTYIIEAFNDSKLQLKYLNVLLVLYKKSRYFFIIPAPISPSKLFGETTQSSKKKSHKADFMGHNAQHIHKKKFINDSFFSSLWKISS